MTSAAVFPSLQAPVQEDSMEMSSPADRLYDDDIDIDFDDNIGGVQLTDDERMMEDEEQTNADATADDMMEDDAQLVEAEVTEQEMHDEFDPASYEQADPDDELIDYGDDDYQDPSQFQNQTSLDETVPEVEVVDQQPEEESFQEIDEEIVREPEAPVPEQALAIVEESFIQSEIANNELDVEKQATTLEATEPPVENEVEPPADPTLAASPNEADPQPSAIAQDETVDNTAHTNSPEAPVHDMPTEKSNIQIPAPLISSTSHDADVPGTPTDTGLHPVIVTYNGSQWPLFKSRNQPDGLIKDDNLASVGLAELLGNCRQRLSIKTGEMISEDQEATISFESMGLEVSENHPACFSTSLHEILEVYKQLHANDGAQHIPPLSLTLSLHLKFSSRFAGLKDAAANGLGIYQCNPTYFTEEYEEGYDEYYQEDDDNTTEYHQPARAEDEDHDHAQQEPVADTDPQEPEEVTYSDQDAADRPAETEYEDNHNQDQEPADGYINPSANDTKAESEHPSTPSEHQDSTAPRDSHEDKEDRDGQDREVPESKAAPEEDGTNQLYATTATETLFAVAGEGDEEEEEEEDTNVESTTSSTTLRGDQANDVVEHGTDGYEDFSTFPQEPEPAHEPKESDQHHSGDAQDTEHDLEAATYGDIKGTAEVTGDEALDHESQGDGLADQGRQGDPSTDGTKKRYQAQDDLQEPLYQEDHDYENRVDETAQYDGPDQEQANSSEPGQVEQVEHNDQYHTVHDSLEHHTYEPSVEHDTPAEEDPVESPNADETYLSPGSKGTPADLEDDIDFDDDTTEQHEARKASLNVTANASSSNSGSPLGKRSFEATDTPDEGEEPELKKLRSS